MAETARVYFEGFDWGAASPNPAAADPVVFNVSDIDELMGAGFRHCGNAADSLSYCEKEDLSSWSTAQSVAVGRRALPFFLILLLGAWLLSLAIVATYRGVGGDG
jgi:hypothetical protein